MTSLTYIIKYKVIQGDKRCPDLSNACDTPCTVADQTLYLMWFHLSLTVIYELLKYYKYIYLSVITNICYIIHTSCEKSVLFISSLLKKKEKKKRKYLMIS